MSNMKTKMREKVKNMRAKEMKTSHILLMRCTSRWIWMMTERSNTRMMKMKSISIDRVSKTSSTMNLVTNKRVKKSIKSWRVKKTMAWSTMAKTTTMTSK